MAYINPELAIARMRHLTNRPSDNCTGQRKCRGVLERVQIDRMGDLHKFICLDCGDVVGVTNMETMAYDGR